MKTFTKSIIETSINRASQFTGIVAIAMFLGGDPDTPYVVFSGTEGRTGGLYFLHGALHLYRSGSEVRKHCWARTRKPLIENILESISRHEYPLFVAEGEPEKKMEQIEGSSYLSACYSKLSRIESPLVIFGLALGESDSHIAQALAHNPKLRKIYFGIYSGLTSPENIRTQQQLEKLPRARSKARRGSMKQELEIILFDSSTARVWD